MVTSAAMTPAGPRAGVPIGPRDSRGYKLFTGFNAVVLVLVYSSASAAGTLPADIAERIDAAASEGRNLEAEIGATPAERAKHGNVEIGGHGKHENGPVAPAEPRARQTAGEAAHSLPQLAKGDRCFPVARERDARRIALSGVEKKGIDVAAHQSFPGSSYRM